VSLSINQERMLNAFFEMQKKELLANSGKGDITEWQASVYDLLAEVAYHQAKLSKALLEVERGGIEQARIQVDEFAADIANYMAKISLSFGTLKNAMSGECSRLYPLTSALLGALKTHGIEPACVPHVKEDGLDGSDTIWLVQSNDGGSWLGEYLSVTKAHSDSNDWIVSYSDRNAYGGDPEHWSEIGSQQELIEKIVSFFVDRHKQINS
jgi:hypothetical protein